MQENNAAKLFCGFELTEITPKHTVFTKVRKRIGTKKLSELFSDLRDQLQSQGYMNEVFSFVDASHLISKANLWKERDKAIKKNNMLEKNKDQDRWYTKICASYERVFSQQRGRMVMQIKDVLLELGQGFSFIGEEYRLVSPAGTESFIDLLFYNRKLQCLTALELKSGKFKPEYAGKMNYYLSLLDDFVKEPWENHSMGIILCKDRDNIIDLRSSLLRNFF